jgi:hypothetical protein
MEKRGQTTLFIILGIVLVILISLVFVYKDSLVDLVGLSQEVVYPSEVEELRDDLLDCFSDTAETTFFELGYQGGYSDLPRDSYETGFLNVPYFFSYGEVKMVDVSEFEEEFAVGFENGLDCVDFSGYNVTEGEMEVNVEISEGLVEYSVDYPLEVVYGATVYDVSESYEFSLSVPFVYVYSVVSEFVESSSGDYIDVSYMLDQDLDSVDYFSPEDETYVFFVLKGTEYGNYTYSFGMKYNFSEVPEVYLDYGSGL